MVCGLLRHRNTPRLNPAMALSDALAMCHILDAPQLDVPPPYRPAQHKNQRPACSAQLATLVGCSMGASCIWSYLELFGDARVSKAVFVDQVPLQVRTWPCMPAAAQLDC